MKNTGAKLTAKVAMAMSLREAPNLRPIRNCREIANRYKEGDGRYLHAGSSYLASFSSVGCVYMVSKQGNFANRDELLTISSSKRKIRHRAESRLR